MKCQGTKKEIIEIIAKFEVDGKRQPQANPVINPLYRICATFELCFDQFDRSNGDVVKRHCLSTGRTWTNLE